MTAFLFTWAVGFVVIAGWLLLGESKKSNDAFRDILYEHIRNQGKTHRQAMRSVILATIFVVAAPSLIVAGLIAGAAALTW